MPSHRQLECWIQYGDERTQEYAVEVEDTSTVNCWIASEAGKTFSVHWRDCGTGIDSTCHIFVDGIEAEYVITTRDQEGAPDRCLGIRNDHETIKSFVFSSVATTDDESWPTSGDGLQKLGTITVEINQIIRGRKFEVEQPPLRGSLRDDPIPEKAKKVPNHRVGSGPIIRSRFRKMLQVVTPYNPRSPGPIVRFNFFYRPRGILQALGHLPSTALPKRNQPDYTTDILPKSAKRTKSMKRARLSEPVDVDADVKVEPRTSSSTAVGDNDEEYIDVDALEEEIQVQSHSSKGLRTARAAQRSAPIKGEYASVNMERKGTIFKQMDGEIIDLTSD